MIRHGSKTIDLIVVHQATTRPEWMQGLPVKSKVAEIRRWHRDRGWKDIGYHWIIDRDGSVAPGRAETTVGAHVSGHNTGSIGICLLGGFGANKFDAFSDHFTPEQDDALRRLIEEIKGRTPIKRIAGHNEFANKACPGFDVMRWYDYKKPTRTTIAESHTAQLSAAQVVSGVGGGVASVAALSGTAQVVALVGCFVVVVLGCLIFRERLKAWVRGQT